jgi:hypothetical protein
MVVMVGFLAVMVNLVAVGDALRAIAGQKKRSKFAW